MRKSRNGSASCDPENPANEGYRLTRSAIRQYFTVQDHRGGWAIRNGDSRTGSDDVQDFKLMDCLGHSSPANRSLTVAAPFVAYPEFGAATVRER